MDDRLSLNPAVILYADITSHCQLTGDDNINTRSGSSAANQKEFIG